MLTELEDFVPKGAPKARFLLAWSAVESAMRVAAQRIGLALEGITPRQLMSELVSAGLLSSIQYERLLQQFGARNRLVHGVPTGDLDSRQIDEMACLARELIVEKPVAAA